jgi:uroporphyrinogen-III synthase
MSPSAVAAALAWERAHPGDPARRFALGHATAEALERAGLDARAPACGPSGVTEELVRELAELVRRPVGARR